MKFNWGHKILIVYLVFVGGILLLVFKSSQQKFDLVQQDYYGAELKYQEVINATKHASELGIDLGLVVRGSFLHITLPPIFQQSETKGEVHLYCIADEKGDLKKKFKSNNGEFDLELLTTMKGNYTLKLTVQNRGVDYYFEKKILL
ncbi:MAG TPA: hypothetical protein DEB23_03800 [Chitinophagaceae bacterium]|jgi:hypothetical protein|nr:hypothetical protein [Chitinophagaceae bacterium]